MNQRVRIDTPGSDSIEYVYNINGQRISIWDADTQNQVQGQAYWGSLPIEFYAGGTAHFQTQDWEGTERLQTSYNGSVEGTYTSLPYGDGYSASGTDDDAYHFARLDQDNSANEHAQYREYSNMAGRWMSPDPYSGSYDFSNPQSFNRYSYVMNNPLGFVDPEGECGSTTISGTVVQCGSEVFANVFEQAASPWLSTAIPYIGEAIGAAIAIDDLGKLLGLWGGPQFHGSLQPRPSAPNNGCSVSSNSLNNYLTSKGSPMAGQGANLMASGARYNLDPRLFVSLAGAETHFGLNITAGQYNAFNVLYNGFNSPFNSWQSSINSVGHSLTNPRNGYDLSNTATMYKTYCHGADCVNGLRNVNTFMNQQGANTNDLRYPCK